MKVSFRQMQVFRAVVVSGSISKATKLTNLSQPTISQQLAKMEQALGTQLLLRRRSKELELTPAGEFWYRSSDDILAKMNEIEANHAQNYAGDRVALRFGATPSLRGRLIGAAAKIVVKNKGFARFDFVWGLSSNEIVKKINTHEINCGVVSSASVQGYRKSLHTVALFEDRLVWAVPTEIPLDVIRDTLNTGEMPPKGFDALTRFVDVGKFVPWHRRTEDWYRANLPYGIPYFGGMTHEAAVDFVAAGLATCHIPMSLVPNLPSLVLDRVRLFDLRETAREAVFVMPRHLLSLSTFVEFQDRLCDFIVNEYSNEMTGNLLNPMPV